MVSLSGSTSETVWISPIPRAMRALLALLPCKGLPRWRGAGRRHGARSCGIRDTRGRRATRRSPACGEWRRQGLPSALRVAHDFESPGAGKSTAARVRSASNWRVSHRAPVSTRLAGGEATPRFSPPPFRRAPEGRREPVVTRRSLRGKRCYVLTNCIIFAGVTNRRRG